MIKAKDQNRTVDTRLSSFITALPKAEYINPLAFPSWEHKESRAEAEAFHPKIPRSDIQIFSDGSKSESKDGATGGGFVITQFDIQVAHYSFSLGTNAEVFDAEAMAAVTGAAKALALPSIKLATDLWIFLDNYEVALRLGSHFNGSSQAVFEDFLKLTQAWAARPRLPHIPPADNQLWNTVSPQYYKDLQYKHTSNTITLSLKRATLHYILAARSQHGDFAAYHERFNHTTAHTLCSCGKRKTPLHFFFCKKGKAYKTLTKSPPSEAIPWLLGIPTGGLALAKWLESTKFYTDICPQLVSAA
ncbi:hypothetical protein SS1G_08788 [Sclerotinia sclerotiorum 1980 UF-70]|uniref:RNase H type-1 domain-containing protein n=1 Tax=Sclerotinia sclerotiorum (strain ATCC 18683 / 1980 / Ss-1) TaxID=665079 RepID=A7ETY1_SCLS1|nr:hypothetical protein SS1G_08788 [Sclerotinia sclerotiorum 1980 UF-70]EDN92923.1 hypothetical protein SS1G_08788 [Sclerotinia sclerotiorum 1980 UF-70]